MDKRIPVLMVQSYGYLYEGKKGEGSKIRIKRAVELVECGIVPRNAIMVWPQAYKPDSWGMFPEKEPLGVHLAKYCRHLSAFYSMTILDSPRGWNTLQDVKNACELVTEEMESKKMEGIPLFYFVSDPVHIVRTRMVWEAVRPSGWEARFYTSAHALTLFDRIVREPVARFIYRRKLARI